MALDPDAALVSRKYRERRIVVVVRWTARLETGAGGLRIAALRFERLDDVVDGELIAFALRVCYYSFSHRNPNPLVYPPAICVASLVPSQDSSPGAVFFICVADGVPVETEYTNYEFVSPSARTCDGRAVEALRARLRPAKKNR